MAGNYNANQVFYYKDKLYAKGTVINVSQSYINTHSYQEKPIWRYARFSHHVVKNNIVYFVFNQCNLDIFGKSNVCCGYFLVPADELDLAIDSIYKPNEIDTSEIYVTHPKKDWEVDGMGLMWAGYLAVLTGSLLFTQFYVLWGAASYIFFKCRREMLNK